MPSVCPQCTGTTLSISGRQQEQGRPSQQRGAHNVPGGTFGHGCDPHHQPGLCWWEQGDGKVKDERISSAVLHVADVHLAPFLLSHPPSLLLLDPVMPITTLLCSSLSLILLSPLGMSGHAGMVATRLATAQHAESHWESSAMHMTALPVLYGYETASGCQSQFTQVSVRESPVSLSDAQALARKLASSWALTLLLSAWDHHPSRQSLTPIEERYLPTVPTGDAPLPGFSASGFPDLPPRWAKRAVLGLTAAIAVQSLGGVLCHVLGEVLLACNDPNMPCSVSGMLSLLEKGEEGDVVTTGLWGPQFGGHEGLHAPNAMRQGGEKEGGSLKHMQWLALVTMYAAQVHGDR